MANQIPLAEGVDAAGGYLVRDTYGATLQQGIQRESAVMALARVDRVAGKRQRYAIYAGRPAAGFVGEGAPKPVTGMELAELLINTKKIAATVIWTQELIEDAQEDPTVLLTADLRGSFSDIIDAHALGYAAGAAIVGQFDSELTATTSTVELGATGDAFAVAVSQAMSIIEGNGYRPSGIAAASDVRGLLRDARGSGDLAAMPVYTAGFNREPDTLYGLPVRYTSNLDALPAGAGKVAAVVGDWSQAIFALRRDIVFRTSTEATLVSGGTTHNLFQENKTAGLWEMRLGFNSHDINRAFVRITNSA